MTAAKSLTSPRAAVVTILVAGAAFSLAVNYPGHMEFDGIMQLVEGRTGLYSNWHPPVMSWLLGLSDALRGDAWPFVLLDTVLGYGGFLLLLSSARTPTKLTALLALVFVVTPQLFLFPAIVWKDILFANAATAGFCCLSLAIEARRKGPLLLTAAIILLALAVLARQNGIVILPCAALAYGLATGARGRGRGSSILGRSLLFGLAIGVLAFAGHRLLQLRASGAPGPVQQVEDLQIYDMAGMLKAKPDLPLPILERQAPAMEQFLRIAGRKLYTPALQDPVVFSAQIKPLIVPSLPAVGAQWRALVIAHPLTYLQVRAQGFAWLVLQRHPDQCLTYTLGVLAPDKQMQLLGAPRRYDARDEWLEDNYAGPLVGTPALSHTVFALAGLLCLIVLLARRDPSDWPMAGMLVASGLYALTYFFIGVACQYRYLFATDMTALAAIFYLSFDCRGLAAKFRNYFAAG
jgi:hypothetical protein